jgi:hypothetical protein
MMRTLILLVLLLLPGELVAQQPLPEAVCASVHAERAKFGAITDKAQLSEILNRVAWAHRADGWGLSTKTGGNRCPSPGTETGTEIACDILAHRSDGRLHDVLGSADVGAPSTARCPASTPKPPANRPWAPPSKPASAPEPTDPTDPDPEPDPEPAHADLAEAIARVEAAQAAQAAQLNLVLAAIAAIPAHQLPEDVGERLKELTAAVNQERIVVFKLFGQNVTAVVKEGKK